MIATGIGSMPGEDFAESTRVVLGELAEPPGLVYLPELPARGAIAGMVGRTLGLLELDADLQPAGWRLTGTSGSPALDQRRARSLLRQDLDTFEELAQAHRGPLKIQVTGPWTLAATVERPRGDKLLADHGARRDLAQALAEAVSEHVRDLRKRIASERLIVQLDEPALAAVLDARVPTASGFGRHRSVHAAEATEALGWVLDAIRQQDAESWVHSCAKGTPLGLLGSADGVSVDLAQLGAADFEALAERLESGRTVALGVVPGTDSEINDKQVTESVLRWLDMLGLDPAQIGERLVLTPACGLAGAGASYVRTALTTLRASAASLS